MPVVLVHSFLRCVFFFFLQGVGSPGLNRGNEQQAFASPKNNDTSNNYDGNNNMNNQQGGQPNDKGFSSVQQQVITARSVVFLVCRWFVSWMCGPPFWCLCDVLLEVCPGGTRKVFVCGNAGGTGCCRVNCCVSARAGALERSDT